MLKTTTGEMKEALGERQDFMNALPGEDSDDKKAARLSLGIDLTGLNGRLSGKAERTELEALQDAIGKEGCRSFPRLRRDGDASSRLSESGQGRCRPGNVAGVVCGVRKNHGATGHNLS